MQTVVHYFSSFPLSVQYPKSPITASLGAVMSDGLLWNRMAIPSFDLPKCLPGTLVSATKHCHFRCEAEPGVHAGRLRALS